jgi:hypothetical protein
VIEMADTYIPSHGVMIIMLIIRFAIAISFLICGVYILINGNHYILSGILIILSAIAGVIGYSDLDNESKKQNNKQDNF